MTDLRNVVRYAGSGRGRSCPAVRTGYRRVSRLASSTASIASQLASPAACARPTTSLTEPTPTPALGAIAR
jgi:hypothetical protein